MKSPSRSLKWIIFRVLNYIQIVGGLLIIVLSFIGNWPLHFAGVAEFLGFLLAMLGFGSFLANGLSNLYLIERFFPDQLPPAATSRFNMFTYVLLIIMSSLLLLFLFFLIFQRLNNPGTDDVFPLLAWIFFGTLAVTSIPIWYLQANLRRTLKKNYYSNFDQFLENDSFPESENE